jgi:hypothetical protein
MCADDPVGDQLPVTVIGVDEPVGIATIPSGSCIDAKRILDPPDVPSKYADVYKLPTALIDVFVSVVVPDACVYRVVPAFCKLIVVLFSVVADVDCVYLVVPDGVCRTTPVSPSKLTAAGLLKVEPVVFNPK